MMSQARFIARRRLGLPLPEIDDRHRNFWARIDAGVHGELLVQRPVHVPGDGDVPVL
jgi:hypothetical protein